jgi:hypothetical protein
MLMTESALWINNCEFLNADHQNCSMMTMPSLKMRALSAMLEATFVLVSLYGPADGTSLWSFATFARDNDTSRVMQNTVHSAMTGPFPRR